MKCLLTDNPIALKYRVCEVRGALNAMSDNFHDWLAGLPETAPYRLRGHAYDDYASTGEPSIDKLLWTLDRLSGQFGPEEWDDPAPMPADIPFLQGSSPREWIQNIAGEVAQEIATLRKALNSK